LTWALDNNLFALLVGDSLANLTGFVGTDFLWTSGARFTGNNGTLLGWEWMTLLFLSDPAILFGILFAVFLINAHLVGNIMANLFVLIATLFPWNILASLGRFISAHLMRNFTANFGWFVDADSLVVDGGSMVDLLALLSEFLINLGDQLFLLLNDLFLD